MIRAALLLALAFPSFAAEPLVSGVPVGGKPGPYSFLVATGLERGKLTCFVCEQAGKPTAVVFARNLSDPLGKLMTTLDAEAALKPETGFKAWMTLLTPKADLDGLAAWAKKQGIKASPVGAFEDVDGPPAYKIHADAEVTILLFVKQKVVANFVYRAGEFDEKRIPDVKKALPGLLVENTKSKD